MIKSLLDDEEPREEKEERGKRGLLKRRLGIKEDFLSITGAEDAEEPSPAETEDEIRNGILGLSSPDPEPPSAPESQASHKEEHRLAEGFRAPEPEPGTGRAAELEKMLKDLEEELQRERELEKKRAAEAIPLGASDLEGREPGDGPPAEPAKTAPSIPFSVPDEPESQLEVFRKTGLAWSAAIAMFGSVVFMLAIGWVADVLLGSSPWGIVTGIVLGAAIGFFQLFRISSQILKPGSSDFDKVSLRSAADPDPVEDAAEEMPAAGDRENAD